MNKFYSQFGEDKIIQQAMLENGLIADFFVDIGAYDGVLYSNTKALEDLGVKGLMFDAVDRGNSRVVIQKFNAENINLILDSYGVPNEFSVLSIDVDGNDYWLWKALKYEPDIVVIEYNPNAKEGYIKPYDPDYMFSHETGGFDGTSRSALEELAVEKGYRLLDYTPANLLFIKN